MRISKLSERAGLPVGTVKFYLRSGLLHHGRATSATQALYDDTHLARLRMIRALFEVGGLSLADIQRILTAVDFPAEGTDASVALVEEALAASACDVGQEAGDLAGTHQLLMELGWQVSPDSPHLAQLARTLAALDAVGITVDHERVKAYADAAAHVARNDLAALREVPDENLPALLAATSVLFNPLLAALRQLARESQHRRARTGIPGPRVSAPSA